MTMFRAQISSFGLSETNVNEGIWWRCRDSNPGHADYDSAALTN